MSKISNRIVVDYKGEEKIIFLGIVLNMSSNPGGFKENEIEWDEAFSILRSQGIEESDIVKTSKEFNFTPDLCRDLKNRNKLNEEGYVLRFSPSNYRIKVKFEEYCRLHKIITNVSNVDIWEKLKDNLPLDEILDKVPDEFYGWVKKTENDLRERFQDIIEESEEKIYSIKKKLGDSERRTYAEEIKKEKNPGVLFNLLDGRSPDQIIWKLVRPKWSKPFKEET